MTPQRQGEIALKVLEHLVCRRGITLSQNVMRQLGNTAKEIGISSDELKEFAKPIMQKLLDECFSEPRGLRRRSEN